MVKAASGNRDAKTARPLGRPFNDLIIPIFFRNSYEKATAWLYAYELGQRPALHTAAVSASVDAAR